MAWKCWNCGEENLWDDDRRCVMCGAGRGGTRDRKFEATIAAVDAAEARIGKPAKQKSSRSYQSLVVVAIWLAILSGVIWFFVSFDPLNPNRDQRQNDPAQATRTGIVREVNTTNINLRSGPGTNYPVTAQFPSGTRLIEIQGSSQQLEDGSTWIKVTTPNQSSEGWVNKQYLR